MRHSALYGKGDIGRSTVASHLSYTIAERGLRVLQVGGSFQCGGVHESIPMTG